MANKLFPETEKYIDETDLINKHRGHQAQLFRILGQGTTKSKELDFPPAEIERKMELVGFKLFQNDPQTPRIVKSEIAQIQDELDKKLGSLRKREVQKKTGKPDTKIIEGYKERL